jgi:hypothetical protein
MADCAACGTRLEEGLTVCPQCGAVLHRPGSFIQTMGWVGLCVALIPLCVGVVTLPQKNYLGLAVGIAIVVISIGMIGFGKSRAKSVPDPTRPSAPPPTAAGGVAG